MTIDRSALGRRSRLKGKKFELTVRDHMLAGLPDKSLSIHRTSQADRAWHADLMIESSTAPQWLLDLWVECEHAKEPTPAKKFEQASEDAFKASARCGRTRVPVVIWRRSGERRLWASTSLAWLMNLNGAPLDPLGFCPGAEKLVTMALGDLLDVLGKRL